MSCSRRSAWRAIEHGGEFSTPSVGAASPRAKARLSAGTSQPSQWKREDARQADYPKRYRRTRGNADPLDHRREAGALASEGRREAKAKVWPQRCSQNSCFAPRTEIATPSSSRKQTSRLENGGQARLDVVLGKAPAALGSADVPPIERAQRLLVSRGDSSVASSRAPGVPELTTWR